MMKTLINSLLLYLLICSACANRTGMLQADFTSDFDTVRLLDNPDKGWYHHLLDNGITRYRIRDDSVFASFPLMDHIYLRLAWSYLEPEEGKYDWHMIDSIIAKYVPMGYGISFRITSKETGRYPGVVNQEADGIQYATPIWVRKAGAKGSVPERYRTKSWTPDWDDPVYLKKLDNFYAAFAAKYDGQPYVRYIDVGSIGEWGEGHTSFSTLIPPTKEEVIANINIFLKHIKKTKIAVTDDLIYYGKPAETQKEILDYCLENNITLRDDSPMVAWYLQNNLKTWSVTHPSFYDPAYLKGPIIFELEHYLSVKKDSNWSGRNGADTIKKLGYPGAFIMRKAIELEHPTYIGYHGYCEEWLADNPELTVQLANLCGYWYFPESFSCSKKLTYGNNKISIQWQNKGVAPAYKDYLLAVRLSGRNSGYYDLPLVSSGNKKWLPGEVYNEEYALPVASDIPPGKYKIGFKLISETDGTARPVDIGLKNTMFEDDGFIYAGKISIK